MPPSLQADPVPLRVNDGGTIRVGNTRITLDLIVHEHESGSTPEEIVRAYDVLNLADVYAAIAYYIRHREEVTAYLQRREAGASALRQRIEAEQPPGPSKQELMKRWEERQKDHAPPSQ